MTRAGYRHETDGSNASRDHSMTARVVDLFAGIGWAEGLAALGVHELGIEMDPAVCANRIAAGHHTIEADVTLVPTSDFHPDGIIASPPCPDWSTAGSMLRREGTTGHLVDAVPTWVKECEPDWVICEQVPQALEVWEEHADLYRLWGYDVWCGVLDAVNYGVPQNRLRAILIADRRDTALPPAPTHTEGSVSTLLGDLLPSPTLAELLGLERGWFYDSGQNSHMGDGRVERYHRSCDRPAGTLTTKCVTQWVLNGPSGERRKLSIDDALAIQTFRPDLPLTGTREQQHRLIGNAVPPLFARALATSVINASAVAA